MGDGGTMMGTMMGGWMLLWALLGLAVLVLAALGGVWLARRLGRDRDEQTRGTSGPSDAAPGAQELLRRRYAAGEIDREEYLRTQRDLAEG
ncbi:MULTISPECIES: hypothetical protein [Modestobacter]|jgi:putative membrane protein|uniref:SHOCT domain-containing protein n=1 Tax=Modestobacter caceresii TaxID=1522368 RepID=A0A098Y3G1_9ACTN|nr:MULTISPECIES: hypothetical protein [Modestobacter]KGH45408.1 hypothetical protein IN07_17040 [Modestobacter caceresii]